MRTVRRAATALLIAVAAAAATTGAVASAAPAAAPTPPGPAPYHDPAFACRVIDYGTRPPTLLAPPDDPLCVRYDKSNITLGSRGVLDFLAAEPGRIAIVAGACRYWQQDHWVVRLLPGTTPLIEWYGSYWYDLPAGAAGGILRGLRVAGHPVSGAPFIAVVRTLFGSAVADQLAPYTAPGGGGGLSFTLPSGLGGGACG